MTRARSLIVAGSVAAAIVAGIWAGGAASPDPPRTPDAPAVARLDAARVQARAALSAAVTPIDVRTGASDVAAVYRRAAPSLPDHQAPLRDAARAYETLAASTAATYTTAADRAQTADSALAAALRHPAGDLADPLVPPVLPLVLIVSAAAGAAVAGRRRKAETPEPRFKPAPPRPANTPRWDSPPADYAKRTGRSP
jgi:hypothetical protein